MTVSQGGLGVWWGKNAAVYIYKNLFTKMFIDAGERFTISAMLESCRKALGYMGSHSGWDGEKEAAGFFVGVFILGHWAGRKRKIDTAGAVKYCLLIKADR